MSECLGVSGGGCGTEICGSVLAHRHSNISLHENVFLLFPLDTVLMQQK